MSNVANSRAADLGSRIPGFLFIPDKPKVVFIHHLGPALIHLPQEKEIPVSLHVYQETPEVKCRNLPFIVNILSVYRTSFLMF